MGQELLQAMPWAPDGNIGEHTYIRFPVTKNKHIQIKLSQPKGFHKTDAARFRGIVGVPSSANAGQRHLPLVA